MKISVCVATVLVSAVSASYQPHHYGPTHRGAYGGAGGHGGGIDPMMFLLMQKGGSLGEISYCLLVLLLLNHHF